MLRGAGTRMATFFYAMLRLIRLQTALKATVNQVKFRESLKSVSSTVSIRECVADLEDARFFKYESEQLEVNADAEDRFVLLPYTFFMFNYYNLTLTVSQ